MIRSGNYLDLAIADARIKIETNNRGEIPTHRYDSDHKAIEVLVREVGELERGTNELEGKRLWYNFTGTNWKAWTEQMEKIHQQAIVEELGEYDDNNDGDQSRALTPNTRNLDNEEIKMYIGKITKLILANIKENEPKQRRCNNMKCYTNATIERLYKYKSLLITKIKTYRRNMERNQRYQQNNRTSEIHRQVQIWKTEIKRTVQLIEQNVKMQIEKYWTIRMTKIKPGNKMWAEIKNMTKSSYDINVRALEIDDQAIAEYDQLNIPWNEMSRTENNKFQILEEQINLNIIGHHIEKHTRRNPSLGKPEHERYVNEIVEPIKRKHEEDRMEKCTKSQFTTTNRAEAPEQPADDPNYYITIEYLANILKKANNKKSFGPDLIPNIILKHLPNSIIIEICIIFNNLLNNKTFPNCWKVARIFQILKKDKNSTVYYQ